MAMAPETDFPIHQLGVMEGRLGALEERVGRHELFVGNKLTSIEGKLDAALVTQAEGASIRNFLRGALLLLAGASGWVAVLWQRFHGP